MLDLHGRLTKLSGIVELYCFRHSIAEPAGSRRDSERRLTAEGVEKTRLVARGIKRLGLTFDLILTSPLVRARQTAEIVAGELDLADRLKETPALVNGEPFEALIDEINGKHSRKSSIVLVGHEPHLSSLISFLISGGQELEIAMKKAGFARLSIGRLSAGCCARLDWLIPPKVFTGNT